MVYLVQSGPFPLNIVDGFQKIAKVLLVTPISTATISCVDDISCSELTKHNVQNTPFDK